MSPSQSNLQWLVFVFVLCFCLMSLSYVFVFLRREFHLCVGFDDVDGVVG